MTRAEMAEYLPPLTLTPQREMLIRMTLQQAVSASGKYATFDPRCARNPQDVEYAHLLALGFKFVKRKTKRIVNTTCKDGTKVKVYNYRLTSKGRRYFGFEPVNRMQAGAD